MKNYLVLFTILAFIVACKEQKKQPKTATIVVDTVPFYPYQTAIKNEADSLIKRNKKFIEVYTNPENVLHTKNISKEVFSNLVNTIIHHDITKNPLKPFYKEQIFTDLTTNSTVINYTTQQDSLPIKNVSIMLDAKNANTLKRIDIKSIFSSADTLITENYAWIFGKECYILKYAEIPNGKAISTKTNISWQ